jgi:hypothetical protein
VVIFFPSNDDVDDAIGDDHDLAQKKKIHHRDTETQRKKRKKRKKN